MIKISQIQIKTVKKLLFYSFLSFLIISILHNHKYVMRIDSVILSDFEKSSEKADHFLDSDLNCIIHTYSNTISIDFENIKTENIFLNLNVITQQKDNLPIATFYSANKLRGPPL